MLRLPMSCLADRYLDYEDLAWCSCEPPVITDAATFKHTRWLSFEDVLVVVFQESERTSGESKGAIRKTTIDA